MEQPEAQHPTADVTDASLTPAPEGSGSATEQPATNDAMNDIIRQAAAGRSASNPGGVVPTAELNAARSAESAPDEGDESADGPSSDAGQQPGRRARKAEANAQRIADLEATNARLEAAIAEANPPPPDASEEARKRHVETEQRYRRLRDKSDRDTDWDQGDYDWLQEEKERRKLLPDLTAQYEAALDAEREHANTAIEAERQAFQVWFGADVDSTLTLPGLDDAAKAAIKASPRFSDHVLIHRRAERAIVEAEQADELGRLRNEVAELRRNALGFVPAIPDAGRSAGSGPTFDMNTFIRQAANGRLS